MHHGGDIAGEPICFAAAVDYKRDIMKRKREQFDHYVQEVCVNGHGPHLRTSDPTGASNCNNCMHMSDAPPQDNELSEGSASDNEFQFECTHGSINSSGSSCREPMLVFLLHHPVPACSS